MNRTSIQVRNYLALVLLAAAPKVFAQAAPQPAAPAPAAEASEETIMLDPFTVSEAESADGYQVKDTLAGSRVRTELKDVGSSVTVVNAQFMQDIGAKNSEDLLKYTASTEVGGTSGNFAGVGNGRQVGEGDKLLRPNANTRVRGLAAADNTRDYFLTDIPWDGYIVDRVDLARGANALMYGMGSPAGIINSSLNDASFKDANKVEFRTDSESSYRFSADFNKVLIPKQLAIRISGLHDHTYYRQKPAYNFDKRAYGALRWDPAFLRGNGMATSIKVKYEHGDVKSNRPRSLTPADMLTQWWTSMGTKTYNPVLDVWNIAGTGANKQYLKDGSVNPNFQPWLGAYGNVYGNAISFVQNGDGVASPLRDLELKAYKGIDKNGNWDGGIAGEPFGRMVGIKTYTDYMTANGSPYAAVGAIKDIRLSDATIFDYYNNLLDGETKREWRRWDAANLFLTQSFFDSRLAFNVVFDRQRYTDGQFNGTNQSMYVDINTHYLDGSVNPNKGKVFVQSDNTGTEFISERDNKRFSMNGELRSSDLFGRGLASTLIGRHQFTGSYANEKKDAKSFSFLRYAMPESYNTEVGKALALDSNERAVTTVTYLSGDLSGTSTPSGLFLSGVQGNVAPANTGTMYRYNSAWKRSTVVGNADYVNPGAAWTPTFNREGEVQADNPENYYGWGNWATSKFLSYENGDAASLYTNGSAEEVKMRSQTYVWQGYMLDEKLVPMIGWRRDVARTYTGNAPEDSLNRVTTKEWDTTPTNKVSAESVSWSLVGHTPDFIKTKMPLGIHFDLFYNRSRNVQPRAGDKDMTGAAMDMPSGQTKDFGFVVYGFDDKLSLKVNWFQTKIKNDRLQGFDFWRTSQVATVWIQSAIRVEQKDPASDWKWSATKTEGTRNPTTQAVFDAGSAALLKAFRTDPLLNSWAQGWGFSQNLTKEVDGSSTVPAGIAASTDTTSKGVEFELNYQPTKNWNIALNVSKTKATQENIGGALKQWIEAMDTLAASEAGDLRVWWAGDETNFRTWFKSDVMSQFNLLKLKEGSNVPELRPWRVNVVSGYNFSSGMLKGVNVGAAYRWEDKVEIGYPVIVTSKGDYVYDVSNPYKGPSEDHVDLWVGYGHKLTKKVDWRIQLNLRNAFASKRLIPVSVNPDGSGAAYRIPELTSWQLTNTFSF